MTLIDQRILISAPPEGVWRILADPDQMPRWHAGYSGVSVLTTQSTGVGTRRRCSLVNGKDVIEHITAWVEGWGYEYTLVEGGPWSGFQGRFRLQAGPDGTSVQWTVTYQPKGPMGALRDRLSGRRQVQDMMATSLRQLRRAVEELGLRMDESYRSRVSIRERLNAEERAEYYRRSQPADGDSPPAAAIVEPTADPSFVSDLTGPVPEAAGEKVDDAQDRSLQEQPLLAEQLPEIVTEIAPEHAAFAPPEPVLDPDEESIPDYRRITPPSGIPVVRPTGSPAPSEPPTGEPNPDEAPSPVAAAAEDAAGPATSPPAGEPAGSQGLDGDTEPITPPPSDTLAQQGTAGQPASSSTISAPEARSTRWPTPLPLEPKPNIADVSIWEVFGIRRPSEEDSEILDTLVQSVQAKTLADRRAQGPLPKRPVRVRRATTALGLRRVLTRQTTRTRAWEGSARGDEKTGA